MVMMVMGIMVISHFCEQFSHNAVQYELPDSGAEGVCARFIST